MPTFHVEAQTQTHIDDKNLFDEISDKLLL